jgi:hypothetical protein
MCGNRVEELEARVQELEASVEGLTDELVECKVRLRELENAVDEDLGFSPDEPIAESRDESQSPEEVQEAEATKTEAAENEDSTESESSDIIIA